MTLEAYARPETDVLIDTSALLAYVGGSEPTAGAASRVFDDLIRSDRNRGVISSVTAAEALVRPQREGTLDELVQILLDHDGLVLRPVDFLVASEAARIRARAALSLGDALILATGVLSSCSCLVTNDRALAKIAPTVIPGLAVCLLSELPTS